ncbi:MAG: hypothetical protein AAGE43_15375 [Pseudomonadota bacterium]
MAAFRAFLVLVVVVVGAYTAVTITNHGINLFPDFFGDMAEMGWPGQFNLDFMFFLAFSALWVSWRHEFSGAGLTLGVGAFLLGAPYLATYLLIQSFRAKGDVRVLLLGEGRAAV